MSKFKPDDLALVIRARVPENVGKVVRLIESYQMENPPPGFQAGTYWTIQADGGFTVAEFALTGGVVRAPFADIHESWLMPLRGDEDPEMLERDVPLEVCA